MILTIEDSSEHISKALLEFKSKCQNQFWMTFPLCVLPNIIIVLAHWENWSQFTSWLQYLPVFSPSFSLENSKYKLQHLTQRCKNVNLEFMLN